MYTVMLAIKNKSILQELQRMHIWGEASGFQIDDVTEDYEHLCTRIRERKPQFLLLEPDSENLDMIILEEVKREKLCKAAAMVSVFPDFKTVRKCFLLGVDDYFVVPFEMSQFIALFHKIEHEDRGKSSEEFSQKQELTELFEQTDFCIGERLEEALCHVLLEYSDTEDALKCLKRILDGVVQTVFERHDWLRAYFAEEDFLLQIENGEAQDDLMKKGIENVYTLFTEYAELYPTHGEGLDRILLYILERPEGDLRQKSISEELYINRSYLSTVFSAQMGVNFVDYVNNVKMKRAAYLLTHTRMKIIEIAGTLDYKDMGYFLKRFKAKYGITPSQYRIPESYEFQI